MSTCIYLLSKGKSEECGCPEEWWYIHNVEVCIHLEKDSSGHILFYGGDWESDLVVEAPTSLEDLKARAITCIEQLPQD